MKKASENKQKIVVFKFGGSALASPEGQRTLKNEVSKAKNAACSHGVNFRAPRFSAFVLSATGKNANIKNDRKLTDLLIAYNDALLKNDEQKITAAELKIKNKLYLFFLNFYDEKFARAKTEGAFFEFFGGGKLLNDELISRGEYFTAKFFCRISGGTFYDSKNLVFINDDGKINYKKTNAAVKNAISFTFCETNRLAESSSDRQTFSPPFITGFYGNRNGKIKLLPRGGGDESGALVSNAFCADLYVNYTDSCGIKNAPPDIIKNAKTFGRIFYGDLKTLCFSGATVLSEQAAAIICRKKIKTEVKNALISDSAKTVTAKKRKHVFKAISLKTPPDNKNGLCEIYMLGKAIKSKKSRREILRVLKKVGIEAKIDYDKKSVRLELSEADAEKAIKLLYKNFIAGKTCRKNTDKIAVSRW